MKAYDLIGYDAVGVGRQDLAGGLDFLLTLKNNSKLEWLSANIIETKTGKPLFKPFISRQLDELKVGVIGLTGQLPHNTQLLNQNTSIIPWHDALPQIIDELADTHDFIVLLTDLDARECRNIAETYAINIIVQAKNSDAGESLANLSERTIMVATGKKGKYIGVMEIDWVPGGIWRSVDKDVLIAKKKTRESLTRQLDILKDRPQNKYNYEQLQKRLATIEDSIKKLELKNQSEKENISSYDNKFMAMNTSLPNQPAVQKIVDETKRVINELNQKTTMNQTQNIILSGRGFVGWTACRDCHRNQVKAWQASRHASSYLTLMEKGQQFNLNCLPCHITGANRNDPAASVGIATDLQVVGCESCHGPGILHSTNPANRRTAPVEGKTCLVCHTPEQDDSFDFASDQKRINCPI